MDRKQNALVATSKYSERTLGTLADLFNDIIEKNPEIVRNPKFQALKKEVLELHFKSMELEKVKRGFILNFATSKKLLFDKLKTVPPKKKNAIEEHDELNKYLKLILKRTEPDGELGKLKMEESILAEDIYASLFAALWQRGYIKQRKNSDKNGLPQSHTPLVDNILKARCGFSITTNPQLNKLHKKSREITLNAYGFDSETAIEKFNDRVYNLTIQVNNLSIREGAVITPAKGIDDDLSLRYQWQDAIICPTKMKSLLNHDSYV